MIKKALFVIAMTIVCPNIFAQTNEDAVFMQLLEKVQAEDARSIEQLTFLADQEKQPQAQFALAQLYEYGLGVDQDEDKAHTLYEAAATQAYAPAQTALGIKYQRESNDERALFWLEKAVNQQDINAFKALAQLYLAEPEAEGNVQKALSLYERAAEQGDAHAQFNLGRLYLAGDHVVRDPQRAKTYFEHAVAQNDMAALYELALMYLDGDGVTQDYQKAAQLLNQIVAADDNAFDDELMRDQYQLNAQYCLASLYEEGLGITQDLQKAFALYEAAAVINASAMTKVGLMYLSGLGVEKNTEKARDWLEMGFEAGDEEAELVLQSLK